MEQKTLNISTPAWKWSRNKWLILEKMWISEEENIKITKSDVVLVDDFIVLKTGWSDYTIPCPKCLSDTFRKREIECITSEEDENWKIIENSFRLEWAICLDCWYFQQEYQNWWWTLLDTIKKTRKMWKRISEVSDQYIRNLFSWISSFFLSKNFLIMFLAVALIYLLAANKDIQEFSANILGSNVTISRDIGK